MKPSLAILAAFMALVLLAATLSYLSPGLRQLGAQQGPFLSTTVFVASQQMSRGEVQMINVKVVDSQTKRPVEGASVEGKITYPSGSKREFQGATDSDGTFQYWWIVEPDAQPGQFEVWVKANALGYNPAVGITWFFVSEAVVTTPPYRGQVSILASAVEGKTAEISLKFIPPTSAGVQLFIVDPQGVIQRKPLAAVGESIYALSHSLTLKSEGVWKVWALSGNLLSEELRLNVG